MILLNYLLSFVINQVDQSKIVRQRRFQFFDFWGKNFFSLRFWTLQNRFAFASWANDFSEFRSALFAVNFPETFQAETVLAWQHFWLFDFVQTNDAFENVGKSQICHFFSSNRKNFINFIQNFHQKSIQQVQLSMLISFTAGVHPFNY